MELMLVGQAAALEALALDLQSCEEFVKLLKGLHFCAVIGGRKLCAALIGPRSEARRLAQAVALELSRRST